MSTKIFLLILALSPDPVPGQEINPIVIQSEAPSMEVCLEVATTAPGKALGNLKVIGASCVAIESRGKQI